jgi:hypothetical protein
VPEPIRGEGDQPPLWGETDSYSRWKQLESFRGERGPAFLQMDGEGNEPSLKGEEGSGSRVRTSVASLTGEPAGIHGKRPP